MNVNALDDFFGGNGGDRVSHDVNDIPSPRMLSPLRQGLPFRSTLVRVKIGNDEAQAKGPVDD